MSTFAASALLVSLATLGAEPRGVVLDFGSENCFWCRKMDPIVHRLQREGLPIRQIDVNERPELAKRFKINELPAFVVVVDNKIVARRLGAMQESELRQLVAKIPAARPEQSAAPANRAVAADSSNSRSVPAVPVNNSTRSRSGKSGVPLSLPLQKKRAGSQGATSEEPIIRAKLDQSQTQSAAVRDPLQASARIRVKDKSGINYGSGTIIESRPGRTIVLTCGHVLRGLNANASVEVDVFTGQRHETYVGKALVADLKADVGLIVIPTTVGGLATTPVASTEQQVARGDRVFSIGCGGGEPPTQQNHDVTVLNRYLGPDNIECTGVPLQGRSGGGLFNGNGEVVGVCIAQDPRDKRGLYCGLKPIHDILDRVHLSHLYRGQQPTNPSEDDERPFAPNEQMHVASAENEMPAARAVELEPAATTPARPFNPFAEESATEPTGQPFAMTASTGGFPVGTDTVSQTSQGNQFDIERDRQLETVRQALEQAGEAEVVCIIRPLNDPQAASRVVIINRASSKFVAYLQGEVEQQLQPTSASVREPLPEEPSSRQFRSSRQTAGQAPVGQTPAAQTPARNVSGLFGASRMQPTARDNPEAAGSTQTPSYRYRRSASSR